MDDYTKTEKLKNMTLSTGAVLKDKAEQAKTVMDKSLDAMNIKPAWRGWLHVAAFLITLPAGIILLNNTHQPNARLAVLVYVTCLAGLFAVSGSYHRLARKETTRTKLRRADHAMIFLAIAGTYTPLCLLGLDRQWGIPLLVVIWTACLVGAGMKIFAFDNNHRTGQFMYILLGWAAVVALPAILHTYKPEVVILLALGGIFYTIGAVVLAKNSPNWKPQTFGYHEVFHTFTILGAGCHFLMVGLLATGAGILA